MKLTPGIIDTIKDSALRKFRDKHYSEYEAVQQATLCTVLAFCDAYERATGVKLLVEVVERAAHEPIDDL